MANVLNVKLNVREVDLFPRVGSVADAVAGAGHAGVQLLRRYVGPASAVSGAPVGPAGGSWRPEGWADDPQLQRAAVTLYKLAGAYYFPRFGVLIDRHGNAPRAAMAQATYSTPDLGRLPCMRVVDGTPVFSAPADVETLASAVITMPWAAITNYGHFVCDCLTAVVVLRDLPEFRDAAHVFPPLKRWHLDHLGLLAVPPVELPRDVYFIEAAFFTSCMDTFLLAPNVTVRRLASLELSAAGLASDEKRPRPTRKIWISRGFEKRRFLSQDAIETALRAKGFEIVRPETMSIAEQIELFANASLVAGCAGAGFANLIYCAPGAVVVEIEPEGFATAPWVRNLCLLMNCRWAPYFCRTVAKRPVVIGGQVRREIGMDFDVDHEDFLRHVDAAAALASSS